MDIEFKVDSDAFRKSIDETRDRFEQAFAVSKNMIASMMQTAVRDDIASAGNYSPESVTVEVEGDTITTTVDLPGASILETGGTIYGHPLLWLPFSGTDAEGIQASDYGDRLFSVNRPTGGVPLLFSIKDRKPKYFGVPNVHVPKQFHLAEITERMAASVADVFERALNDV